MFFKSFLRNTHLYTSNNTYYLLHFRKVCSVILAGKLFTIPSLISKCSSSWVLIQKHHFGTRSNFASLHSSPSLFCSRIDLNTRRKENAVTSTLEQPEGKNFAYKSGTPLVTSPRKKELGRPFNKVLKYSAYCRNNFNLKSQFYLVKFSALPPCLLPLGWRGLKRHQN